MWGLPLDSLICTPDSWLEVSLQPEGPTTAHFDQDFSIFSHDPVANVELLRRLYFALHVYHVALPTSTSEFPPKRNLPNVIKTYLLSFNCKIQPKCSNFITYCKLQQSIASSAAKSASSGISPEERSALRSNGPHLITLPASLPKAAPCPKPTVTEGRAITAWEPSEA